MHFCRQILVHRLSCQNEFGSIKTHLAVIYTQRGNALVYHLVSRRIVISYQAEIFSALQSGGSTLLYYFHNFRLSESDVNFIGFDFVISHLAFVHLIFQLMGFAILMQIIAHTLRGCFNPLG